MDVSLCCALITILSGLSLINNTFKNKTKTKTIMGKTKRKENPKKIYELIYS